MTVLSAKNLRKEYHGNAVVESVSLQVETGQIVGLLGPNGAGKTTSFYMIVGLVEATDGHVFIDDREITSLPIHERAKAGIGYLPQEPSVFRKLSVFDNLMGIVQLNESVKRQDRKDLVNRLLDEFQLGRLRKSYGMGLSGGERRRVEIARALAASPKFILLDEPFAGADPISAIEIKKIVRHLRDRGIGILITDHNVRETLEVCEKAYIVSHGNVIAEGTSDQVMNNETVRKVYLGEDFRM